jgi:hypothetical protein
MEAMTAYRIKDWELHFEKRHNSSEVVFRWVALPTKHDGKSFRRLARHNDGVRVFAAWILMTQIAGKLPVRGTLIDENGPLTPIDLSDSTGFPPEIFQSALQVLSDPVVGIEWLEAISETDLASVVATCRDLSRGGREKSLNSTGQDSTEQRKLPTVASATPAKADEAASVASAASPAFLTFPTIAGKKTKAREWVLHEDYVSEMAAAFTGVDVRAECQKALVWVRANPTKCKTADGMREFLFKWMCRSQNSPSGGNGGTNRNGKPRVSSLEEWQRKR